MLPAGCGRGTQVLDHACARCAATDATCGAILRLTGVTEAQRQALLALGAVERNSPVLPDLSAPANDFWQPRAALAQDGAAMRSEHAQLKSTPHPRETAQFRQRV